MGNMYEQLTESVRKAFEEGKQAAVMQLFSAFHAASLEEVAEDDYPKLLENMAKVISDTPANPTLPDSMELPQDISSEEPCAEPTFDQEATAYSAQGQSELSADANEALLNAEELPQDAAVQPVEATAIVPVEVKQPEHKQEGSAEKLRRLFDVLTFGNRAEKVGMQEEVSIAAIYNRFSQPAVVNIARADYLKLSAEKQANLKDQGMYIFARSENGKRDEKSITHRSAIALDLDHAPKEYIRMLHTLPFSAIYHTTFKSTPDAPRIRVIVLLSRDVTPAEYRILARQVAKLIGEEYIDPASYRPAQAMYFPVVPKDGVYQYGKTDGPLLNPDDYLEPAPATDSKPASEKSDDPGEKVGWIGAFNRAYPIRQLLASLLAEVYDPTDDPNRYHYRGADSAAGMIVYDDGYACSFHASDPAQGQRLCAFDLGRIHLFGHLDKAAPEGTKWSDLPSQKAMLAFAQHDPAVQQEYQNRKETDDAWKKKLQKDKKGKICNSLQNAKIILLNDPKLSSIRYNLFDNRYEADQLPWVRHSMYWSDHDKNNLICYFEENYGFYSGLNIAFNAVIPSYRYYHPVRDYITARKWDGVERLDTLLIDYLGAEDTAYTRAVTRKAVVASVARAFQKKAKFDYMPVICGPQGIGKSTLLEKLAVNSAWFTDSVAVSDMRDVKKAGEKILGKLIVEISELQGMRMTDVESVKAFLSSNQDNYRKAYDTSAADHPRQSVLWGTTNSMSGYLRDITGNRRFWPINVSGRGTKHAWDLDDETVGQIWAEAKVRYDQGEELYLKGEVKKAAEALQREALEKDDREGLVRQYLDTPLPEGWTDMSLYERREYLANPTGGTVVRDRVSVIEIWCEAFGQEMGLKLKRQEGDAIRRILESLGDEWAVHTGQNGKPSTQLRKPYGKQIVYYRVNKEGKGADEENK